MPAAVAPCTGSMRLVPVKQFNDKDEVPCPGCGLNPKSTRKTDRADRYYLTPNHRPQGERRPESIDWSNVE